MQTLYALGIKELVFVGDGYSDTGARTVRVADKLDEEGKIHCLMNKYYPFIDEEGCKEVSGVTSEQEHDVYKKAYPDGYEVVWIGYFETEESAAQAVKERLL